MRRIKSEVTAKIWKQVRVKVFDNLQFKIQNQVCGEINLVVNIKVSRQILNQIYMPIILLIHRQNF